MTMQGADVETETTPTAVEAARALINRTERDKEQRAALISELRAQREAIDQALAALGAKRRRAPRPVPPKRGRPRKQPAVVSQEVA